MRIDSSGNVGITSSAYLGFNGAGDETHSIQYDSGIDGVEIRGQNGIKFATASGSGSERMRIDHSGRLLVGLSSARANFYNSNNSPRIQLEGNDNNKSALAIIQDFNANTQGAQLILAKNNSQTIGSNVLIDNGDICGTVSFQGSDGSQFIEAASITCAINGTPGSNDMPGRLSFSTTADGDSNPTTRMTINSQGDVLIGQSTTTQPGDNNNVQGLCFRVNDSTGASLGRFYASAGADHNFNRTSDGVILAFRSEGVNEGAVSISGTTVTYGGGHLARWSQLLNNADPSGILKGTVMSNLDEMCEWGEEDNEQLNRTKISDVEGDSNVAGVFVSTSFNDEGPFDFYVGMTGDMVIRIAQGTTVARGDLLMSAGDGTAKPQDDDIVRSKTIAKVTSTTVSTTYSDGSYCVPCVLMAC